MAVLKFVTPQQNIYELLWQWLRVLQEEEENVHFDGENKMAEATRRTKDLKPSRVGSASYQANGNKKQQAAGSKTAAERTITLFYLQPPSPPMFTISLPLTQRHRPPGNLHQTIAIPRQIWKLSLSNMHVFTRRKCTENCAKSIRKLFDLDLNQLTGKQYEILRSLAILG